MSTPKFKGIPVELAGVVYIVPALALGSLETFQDRMAGFKGGLDKESVAFTLDITHAALKRNYPEITRAEVADAVGVDNMQEVLDAVLDVSGIKRKALEAGDPPAAA